MDNSENNAANPPLQLFRDPAFPPVVRRERIIVNRRRWEFMPYNEGDAWNVVDVVDRDGDWIDAVAWTDGAPYIWATRRRTAIFLGESEIERAATMEVPLLLLDTPAAWANHTGYWPAACVLDWSARVEVVTTTASLKIRASAWVQQKRRKAARELIESWDASVEIIKPEAA